MISMITIGNKDRTYVLSLMSIEGYKMPEMPSWNLMEALERKFGWHSQVYIDGVNQGITFENLASSYTWGENKRFIRKVASVREKITKALGVKFFVLDDNRLYKLKVEQMRRILKALGEKPFKNPTSLWHVHANAHGVVVSRDYYESHKRLLKDFEALPWPMFMGHYDEDYKEVLIGIGRNSNDLPIVPKEAWK